MREFLESRLDERLEMNGYMAAEFLRRLVNSMWTPRCRNTRVVVPIF